MEEAEVQKNKMADEAAEATTKMMHSEMKGMWAAHEKGKKEQMAKQLRKHAVELDALKQSQMTTQNLFAHKDTPLVHEYKVAEHFIFMTKASETLFDGKPENWPTSENSLIWEATNTTIGWSKDTLGFKVMGQEQTLQA
jgi:hypothetical protein